MTTKELENGKGAGFPLSDGLGGWVSVDDYYPPRFVPSIAATQNMVVNVLLSWNGEIWTFGFTDERYEFPVTHWMQLPPMPNAALSGTADGTTRK